jgi:hypothetical protein
MWMDLHLKKDIFLYLKDQKSTSGLLTVTYIASLGAHPPPLAKKRSVHVHAACPLTESLPNAHAVHTPLPFTVLNFPASQGKHGPPSGPVNPGLQMHCALDPLRSGAALLTGHILQSGLPSGDHWLERHGKQLSSPFAP